DATDGREWLYLYEDEDGNPTHSGDFLVTVAMPFSPEFPATGGASSRPRTTYSYKHRHSGNPWLKYNLGSVVAPNQNVSGASNPPTRMDWTYDVMSGRVATHTTGNPSAQGGIAAGGTSTLAFSYQGAPASINDVAMLTQLTSPRGVKVVYGISSLGQILTEQITGGIIRPEMVSGGLASGMRRTMLTDEGEPNWSEGILGDITLTETANSAYPNGQRSIASRKTKVTRKPHYQGGTNDQMELVTETIYEPVFNKPFMVKDARGNVTTYIYDYMEDLDLTLPHLSMCLGYDGDDHWRATAGDTSTDPILVHLFDEMIADAQALHPSYSTEIAGLIDSGDVNADGCGGTNIPNLNHICAAQTCGNLIRIQHPNVTLQDLGVAQAGAGTQVAFERLAYNDYGQLVKLIDAEQNTHVWVYYPVSNVAGDAVDPAGTQGTVSA
ncbi:MAG: hypothetical protein AAFQ53_13110, partial [Bacteroidota bacterium]